MLATKAITSTPLIVSTMEYLRAQGARMNPATTSRLPDRYPIPEIVIGNAKAIMMSARSGGARMMPNKHSK